MNGNQVYEENYKRKIENLLERNSDKKCLAGFYYYIASDRTYSTIYDYLRYVINFLDYSNKNIEELELDDYTGYLMQIRDKSSTYQIGVYSGLKIFSNYLFASKKNVNNPMAYASRPKFIEQQETIEKREKGFLEKKEMKQYTKNVYSGIGSHRAMARQENWKERDMAIIIIFLTTGMRCSALFKLDVTNIDFDNKILITVDKGRQIQKHALTEESILWLQRWINKREMFLQGVEEEALFISNQRKRMDQSSIYRVVKKYAKDIKDKKITPHKLRATYGTQLYDITKDLYFVQQAMGHSSPEVTEKYIRGKSDNRAEAANIMSSLIIN